jgi:hypothetical protein
MKNTKAKIKIKYNKVQQELKSTILWFVMLKFMPVELQKPNKIFCFGAGGGEARRSIPLETQKIRYVDPDNWQSG